MVLFLVRRLQKVWYRMSQSSIPKVTQTLQHTKGELLIVAAAGASYLIEKLVANQEKALTDRHKNIEMQRVKLTLEGTLPRS